VVLAQLAQTALLEKPAFLEHAKLALVEAAQSTLIVPLARPALPGPARLHCLRFVQSMKIALLVRLVLKAPARPTQLLARLPLTVLLVRLAMLESVREV
jgi:hypothetical protein